jgi:glycerol-3-phosphate dehydrogenase
VQKLQTIAMTAEVPVVREVDVLVAGGGMAGFGAALDG